MELVKMLPPPIRASVIVFAFLAALSARANSSFDWTGEDGVVTIPADVAAEVLDEDISKVEALTSIEVGADLEAKSFGRIVFKNTLPLTLNASIIGDGGQGPNESSPMMAMLATTGHITFNGKVYFEEGCTIVLGNCTINNQFGSYRGGKYKPDGKPYNIYGSIKVLDGCTAEFTSASQVVREYYHDFYGGGTWLLSTVLPYGNSAAVLVLYNNPMRLELKAANLLKNSGNLGFPSGGVLELGGFDQAVGSIWGGSGKASETPNVLEVTSESPATVTFNQKDYTATFKLYEHVGSVAFTGQASLTVATGSNQYTNRWVNGVSTTEGELNVTMGVFVLADNAQWTGPTVNVSGGRFVAQAATGGLSADTDLTVGRTGVIEVPEDKVLRVKSLTVDGQDAGLDGIRSIASLAAAYPDFFEGAGAVSTMDGDPRAELSAALAVDGQVSVEDVTTGVGVSPSGGVTAAVGGEIGLQWAASEFDQTEYTFLAQMTGDAVLSVYVDGSDEPVAVVEPADEPTEVSFVRSESVRVRLVVSGETGAANVGTFRNVTAAIIRAGREKGIELTGASVGVNYVPAGGSLAFSIARKLDTSDYAATGLLIDGVFVAFDDLPNATFTHTVSSRATSVDVEVVYQSDAWYVDDDGSDVGHFGRHPSDAFKTLKKAMGMVKSGDTVHVAAGTYAEEVMGQASDADTKGLCRLVIPADVKVVADEGSAVTFIEGAKATVPLELDGCGLDSVRCAYLNPRSELRGFTLRNGYARSTAADNGQYGGGVHVPSIADEANYPRIVDCVISNCFAHGGAAGERGVYMRCRIVKNRSNLGYRVAVADSGACLYNCYLEGNTAPGTHQGQVTDVSRLVNCTFAAGCPGLRANGETTRVYNTLFLDVPIYAASQMPELHNCRMTVLPRESADKYVMDGDCVVDSKLAIGADLAPKSADSSAVDSAAAWQYYERYVVAAFGEDEAAVDFNHASRVANAKLDVGAVEFDWRGIFGTILSGDGCVKVDAMTGNVSRDATDGVNLPPSGEMSVLWSPACPEDETEYLFRARVTGGTVLAVYRDGEADPFATVTEADGDRSVVFQKSGAVALRFVATGEDGFANVSRFANSMFAVITAADKGISVEGAQFGTNYVARGESLAFTVRRSWDSSHLCTGFTSNSVAYSWEDFPEGFTYTIASKDDNILIEATYADGFTWYADAKNGNDGYPGYHPACAKKTLAAAAALASAGETVYVLPGVYTNGTSGTAVLAKGGLQKTENRVIVPAGVNLVSTEGPEKTIIRGRISDAPLANQGGIGPTGTMRCVYLKEGATLRGFTLADGYSYAVGGATEQTYESAGGVYTVDGDVLRLTCLIADCIISNCHSRVNPAGQSGKYVRCKVVDNGCCWYGRGLGGTKLNAYNCLFKGNKGGAGDLNNGNLAVNCTFLAGDGSSSLRSSYGQVCYNCVFKGTALDSGSSQSIKYYNCYSTQMPTKEGFVWTDSVITNADALAMDGSGLITRDSCLVDTGDTSLYDGQTAALPDEEKGLALYGVQRVYNGAIDVGAYEFDWREIYRADLGAKRWLAVEAVSSNVVETADGAVRLADGSELTLKFTIARLDGEKFVDIPFVQSGAGTLTATLDGAVIEPKDGAFVIKATAAEQTLVLAYSGEGYADLTKMRRNAGVLLLVR